MVGVTAAVGVGSAGALAAAVDGATLGARADEELALLDELAAGLEEPQALTSSVPAMTEAPASQHQRAGRMTIFRCIRAS
jgi:hypothetical protein